MMDKERADRIAEAVVGVSPSPERLKNRKRQLESMTHAALVDLVLRLENHCDMSRAYFRELQDMNAIAIDALKTAAVSVEDALNVRAKLKAQPRERARDAALARVRKDPRSTVEKAEAKRQWERWQRGETRYRSAAEFARAFTDQDGITVLPDTVKNWASDWMREARKNRKRHSPS